MDILESIDRFLNCRMYHYALLINGKWGSGKTYFVKETLIPHVKRSQFDVNYLSLYGVKSTDEISQMLCVQALKDKTHGIAQKAIDSKVGQITTMMLTAMFKGGMNSVGAGDEDIEGIFKILPNFDNNVIIFDDLERCGCSINVVLGYVYTYAKAFMVDIGEMLLGFIGIFVRNIQANMLQTVYLHFVVNRPSNNISRCQR